MTRLGILGLLVVASISHGVGCGGRSPLDASADATGTAGTSSVPAGGRAGAAATAAGSGGAASAGAGNGGSLGGTSSGSAGASAGLSAGYAGLAGATSGGSAGTGGGAAGSGGTTGSGGNGAAAGEAGAANEGITLVGAPLVHAPTASAFRVNAVVRGGSPSALRAYLHDPETGGRRELVHPEFPSEDGVTWLAENLEPGVAYAYEVTGTDEGAEKVLYTGTATTQRPPGQAFTVALITDTHIPPRDDDELPPNEMETALVKVAARVTEDAPDFVLNLGDMLDYHDFGFNAPPPDPSWSRLAYLTYRRFLGDALGTGAHFPVIGNWDGESGCNTSEEIARSRSQRLLYAPGPLADTYVEGGSPDGDYYAFTWGDALFVVLNVMTYTPSCHLLSQYPGLPDDWTLGDAQFEWLRTTLENATAKWRFTFIHHTVAGNGGNPTDSAYGRGGGRAAYVGEQGLIHDLLLEHGVQIFFYAHDHVFEDMVVDGIHYTLPGSAGAPWKFTTYEHGYEEYWPDSGHARLSVSPDAVKVEFVSMDDGSVLYGYTLESPSEG